MERKLEFNIFSKEASYKSEETLFTLKPVNCASETIALKVAVECSAEGFNEPDEKYLEHFKATGVATLRNKHSIFGKDF